MQQGTELELGTEPKPLGSQAIAASEMVVPFCCIPGDQGHSGLGSLLPQHLQPTWVKDEIRDEKRKGETVTT